MRTELSSLQAQSRDLNADNQTISSSLVNSNHTLDLMPDLIGLLRSEIPGLVSISADITHSIGLQFGYLEKLKSNNGDGFGSLRAHKGEESVPIQDIKKEIKAIENIESKLEIPDRPTDALSNCCAYLRTTCIDR
jgi:hypothetical protein